MAAKKLQPWLYPKDPLGGVLYDVTLGTDSATPDAQTGYRPDYAITQFGVNDLNDIWKPKTTSPSPNPQALTAQFPTTPIPKIDDPMESVKNIGMTWPSPELEKWWNLPEDQRPSESPVHTYPDGRKVKITVDSKTPRTPVIKQWDPGYVPGSVLIRYKPNVLEKDRLAFERANNITRKEYLDLVDAYHYTFDPKRDAKEFADFLAKNSDLIELAEPNVTRQLQPVKKPRIPDIDEYPDMPSREVYGKTQQPSSGGTGIIADPYVLDLMSPEQLLWLDIYKGMKKNKNEPPFDQAAHNKAWDDYYAEWRKRYGPRSADLPDPVPSPGELKEPKTAYEGTPWRAEWEAAIKDFKKPGKGWQFNRAESQRYADLTDPIWNKLMQKYPDMPSREVYEKMRWAEMPIIY